MRPFTTQLGVDLGPFGRQLLEIRGRFYPGSPGCTSGPPERWEQPTSAEIEIDDILLVDKAGKLWPVAAQLLEDFHGHQEELTEQVESELEQEDMPSEPDDGVDEETEWLDFDPDC